ncbi:uncharacterized protein LOC120334509 [Styela clava]
MISYRHPYQCISNARWTPLVRFNYAGDEDLEDIRTRKRKYLSDGQVTESKVTNAETHDTQICNLKYSEVTTHTKLDQKKKITLFTIDAILGHSTESPSKKRKLIQFSKPEKKKDNSFDSGISSSEENEDSIFSNTNANESGICTNNYEKPQHQRAETKTVVPDQPKTMNNQEMLPSESYSHIYKRVNTYFYFGSNHLEQQIWMPHQQAIPKAPIEPIAFVGQGCSLPNNHNLLTPRLQKSGQTKRTRAVFTPKQTEHLENMFNNQQYIVGIERRELAEKLRLTDAQVKVWFQNRRIKYRNEKKRRPDIDINKLSILKRQAIGDF